MTVDDDVDVDVDEVSDDANDVEDKQDGDSFPRSYVEQLRTEAKTNRQRAEAAEQTLDRVQRALFTSQVRATGKLADPTDLEYNEELLNDDDALTTAIDELLKKRPHYAAKKIKGGDVGQGVTGKQTEKFSLLGRLQQSV
ncbi:hypothetical protein FHR72_003860 [Mycolicibacterium iranicum]|uniref:Uncharacterized protein n=1 Tax=Mycolicibacterium iranicum TaxID=912594 RepID=A0A839QJA8_MYCIR|nr:hypothetical protein [Mycolicibacterium iranicum]MBB2992361.1 hypothetical protein [Mycolicibacterium iranicum]